jgi:hypothetical protein
MVPDTPDIAGGAVPPQGSAARPADSLAPRRTTFPRLLGRCVAELEDSR